MQIPFHFVYPAVLALVFLVVPFIWLRAKRQPSVPHSQVSVQSSLRSVSFIGWIPTVLFGLWIVVLVAALARPVIPQVNEKRTQMARDITVCTDFSGSMTYSTLPDGPPAGSDHDPKLPYRVLDAARDVAITFVKARQGDRVALCIFDDDTYFHWPLTDDLKIIERKAKLLNKHSGSGTNFEGPTKSDPRSGPIQAAIDHFKDYGQAKTKVLVMISDGEAPISDERFKQLVAQMESIGGKIYILGVGESWTKPGGSSQTEPIRKLVERLGGKWFAAGETKQMLAAIEEINSLEKSKIEIELTTTYKDVYPMFLGLALVLFILYLGSLYITREAA